MDATHSCRNCDNQVSYYKNNASKMREQIDNQFIKAVSDLNKLALDKGWKGIFAVPLTHTHKFGKDADAFKDLTSYEIRVVDGFHENTLLSYYLNKPITLLFLQTIATPCLQTEHEFKEMATVGNLSLYEDVYNHWLKEFNDDICFFNQNREKIIEIKEKLNKLFNQVISEVKEYASDWGRVQVSSFCSGHEFEPIQQYWLCKTDEVNGMQSEESIGRFSCIESKEKFKRLVLFGTEQDLTEVYERCTRELKNMIDQKKSRLCVIL